MMANRLILKKSSGIEFQYFTGFNDGVGLKVK